MRVVAFFADGTNRIFDHNEGVYCVISTFAEREDASACDRFAQQLKAKRVKAKPDMPAGSVRLPGFE